MGSYRPDPLRLAELQSKVNEATVYMRNYYSKVKRATIACTILSLLFGLSTVVLAIPFNRWGEFVEFGIFFITWILILVHYRKNMKAMANDYTRIYQKGFKAWCELADYADWGRSRKYYFFQNERLADTKRVITEFYYEYTKSFSPVRPYQNHYRAYSIAQNIICTATIAFTVYMLVRIVIA